MTDRCNRCGRFVGASDMCFAGIPFGRYDDTEPPEERYICDDCEAAEIAYARKSGTLPSNWVPGDWESAIAEELGFRRACPSGAAWGGWRKELPDGWEWEIPV